MGKKSFDVFVAARGRCASQIHGNPELLAAYEKGGGLAEDLIEIAISAETAEALNQLQSEKKADTKNATAEVARAYLGLQREYRAVLGVVQAVVLDLQRTDGSSAVVGHLEQILVNEAQLQIDTFEVEGVKKRKSKRSVSQEALRAEIEKDAAALVAITAAHEALARRKVDKKRLEALRDAAKALTGKLADRAEKKGARKSTTQQEQEAVERLSQTWTACYRILAAVGAKEPRIQALLEGTTRKRK